MKVSIFGTGYVGLVTGTCFAEMGNDVLCLDIDEKKVNSLKTGVVPIFEPGLAPLIKQNFSKKTLNFSSDLEKGVAHGDVIFIAVGTPEEEDGSADLKHVLSVAETIGQFMRDEKVVVDKSTVPVGTADKVKETIEKILLTRDMDLTVHIASNPEFLKEGAAVDDFMKPDRVVIGSETKYAAKLLEDLYAPFNRNHNKIEHMDIRSAELTKYAANVMLATRISLMNEFAHLADRLDADIEAVRRGIGSDPRIGFDFIYPGTGYGGSCFPKDVKALVQTGKQVDYETEITKAVESVNNKQKRVLFDQIEKHFDKNIQGKTFALWGLAFKPNTDDMREAPSQVLIKLITENGGNLRAYDPEANETAKKLFKDYENLTICNTIEETLVDAHTVIDALIIVTEWNEFRSPNFSMIKKAMADPVIFDGRNLYDPKQLSELGISYYSIGRPIINA